MLYYIHFFFRVQKAFSLPVTVMCWIKGTVSSNSGPAMEKCIHKMAR
uniref:Uncharacterized protein n=1 Tax=Anguilla anguilla TaxID=7936 RepID=A0A0E9QEG9_ANGAN